MRPATPEDDKHRPSRLSLRDSLSFQSIFRSSSQSPERPNVKGPRRTPVTLNASRVSFASHNSGLSHVKLVKVNDFADSDSSSSQYSEEELRDAETIYSVIEEYDWRHLTFHFNEDFDSSGSASESFYDAAPISLRERAPGPPGADRADSKLSLYLASQRGVGRPARTITPTKGQHKRTSLGTEDSHGTPQSRLPDPDITPKRDISQASDPTTSPRTVGSPGEDVEPSPGAAVLSHRDTNTSLSSGELLSRLDNSIRSSNTNTAGRNSVVGNMTAGLDSQSELPVMLYTVHDRDSQNTRWSVYEKQRHMKLSNRPSVPAPTYKAGRLEVRSVLLLSLEQEGHESLQHGSHSRSGSSHLEGSSSGTFSGMISSRLSSHLSNSKMSGRGSSHLSGSGRDSLGRPNPYDAYPIEHSTYPEVPSPPRSITQDSSAKHDYHNNMFALDPEKHDANAEAVPKLLYYSWTKWAMMMVMGLLAVPVYFLLALGFLDFGGYIDHNPLSQLPDEKSEAKLRFFRRYTRTQKMLSVVIGIVWILIVLAMVAVGFGVGLKVH